MSRPIRSVPKSIQEAITSWCKRNIETSEPAVVVSVREFDQRLVDVQPLVIRDGEDGSGEAPTPIQRCPVIFTASNSGHVSIPLEVGDIVEIVYAKWSNDEVTLGAVDQFVPDDNRFFGKGDAVVVGYYPQYKKEAVVSTTDLEIKYKDSLLNLTPNNELKYTNPSSSLTLDAGMTYTNGSFTITVNSDGTFNITGGEGTINGGTVTASGNFVTASGTDLDNLKANFDALVTSYNSHGSGVPNHNPPVPPYVPIP